MDDFEPGLVQFLGGIGALLGNASRRASFASYLLGLLGESERKSMEPIAIRCCGGKEHADAAHQRLNHFITNSDWSDRDVRRYSAHYAVTAMLTAGPMKSWIVDDTGFLKQGKHSVGVQRQYTGSAGKITNCQIGVSLVVATDHDHVPIDFELYLPECWANDPERRAEAKIPDDVVFRTKIQLAIAMLRRAVDDNVPRGVLLADPWYGDEPAFRGAAEELGLDYIVGVKSDHRVWLVDTRGRRGGRPMKLSVLAARIGSKSIRRLTWREGTRHKLSARFAFATVVPAQKGKDDPANRSKVKVIIEWRDGEKEPRFAFAKLSEKVSKKKLVRMHKERWRTERAYQDLKGEFGLDHFEGRRFRGWHHHVSVALACNAFAIGERARLFPPPPRRQARSHPFGVAA